MLKRFWRSLRIPLAFAVACTLYAAAVDRASSGATTRKLGISLGIVIAFYFFTAIGIGLIVTLFGSWATTRTRGTILGFASGALLAAVLYFTIGPSLGPAPLSAYKLLAYMLFIGLFPGAIAGAVFWQRPEQPGDGVQ